MDAHQDRRRGHFHRGRRGSDRRNFERRTAQPPQSTQGRDQIDVEQIMREIRARIAQRHGVELSHQQIDDLAARRLEYILDPRAMKPEFLDMLRRSADEMVERQDKRLPAEPVYVFEDTTLYDSHRAILRFFRTLLNPLLKLFFNPNPLIRALHLQAKLNVEAAEREAARDRRQAEWNALHYRIVERLVTEVSRLSFDVQALSTRLESLGARVDFNDRRVGAMEGTVHQLRPGGRPQDTAPPARVPEPAPAPEGAPESAPSEVGRRRRRRRRGRRGGGLGPESATATAGGGPTAEPAGLEPEGGGEPEAPGEDRAGTEETGVEAAGALTQPESAGPNPETERGLGDRLEPESPASDAGSDDEPPESSH
jgi:hypothetical protein